MEVTQICLNDYTEKIRNVSHIITETVGTITSCTFLEDTLRPYVKRNLKEYIINCWDDGDLKEMVESFKKEAEIDLKEGWNGAVSMPTGDNVEEMKEAIVAHALNQIDNINHKALHCLIVKDGYSKGKLKGHMFPDVLPAFKKWVAEGKKVYTFSSGQEFSQESLISNSVDGDISELISGYFSSSQYPKDKSESFRELCKMVDCTADKVAFLTADAATASAARKAGLMVIMLCREGNSYIGNNARESFPVISSFEDISKQICGKRKKEHDADECGEGKKAKLDETVAEAEVKPEESEKKQAEDSKAESTPKEEAAAAADKVVESKVEEEEEKMEVDEQTEESTKAKEETEKAAPVKISVTPPVEEKASSEVKEEKKEEVVGAEEKVKGGDAEKAETVEEKTEVKKNESEGAEMEVDGKKETDKEAVESKEDTPSKEEEKKNGDKDASEVDGEKEESSVDSKDDAAAAKVEEESVKAEEKVEEKQNGGDDEKPKENGAGDTKLVENGDSKEEVNGVQKENGKEVNGNGVNHTNGDGDAGKEKKTDSATVEVEKPVVKKVENAEATVEPPTAAVQESA